MSGSVCVRERTGHDASDAARSPVSFSDPQAHAGFRSRPPSPPRRPPAPKVRLQRRSSADAYRARDRREMTRRAGAANRTPAVLHRRAPVLNRRPDRRPRDSSPPRGATAHRLEGTARPAQRGWGGRGAARRAVRVARRQRPDEATSVPRRLHPRCRARREARAHICRPASATRRLPRRRQRLHSPEAA